MRIYLTINVFVIRSDLQQPESRVELLLLVVFSLLSLYACSCWAYLGAESLFAKLQVLKTFVGFFAYLIASSFKYCVTYLWASLGVKPSCSSADFNKLFSLSGSTKYGFIYFSYPFFKLTFCKGRHRKPKQSPPSVEFYLNVIVNPHWIPSNKERPENKGLSATNL